MKRKFRSGRSAARWSLHFAVLGGVRFALINYGGDSLLCDGVDFVFLFVGCCHSLVCKNVLSCCAALVEELACGLFV